MCTAGQPFSEGQHSRGTGQHATVSSWSRVSVGGRYPGTHFEQSEHCWDMVRNSHPQPMRDYAEHVGQAKRDRVIDDIVDLHRALLSESVVVRPSVELHSSADARDLPSSTYVLTMSTVTHVFYEIGLAAHWRRIWSVTRTPTQVPTC
jgi:hypothetical protein